jgi:periplasmic divalent cation tolerance protein
MAQSLLYITTENENEARTIARALVESRVVACANILPGVSSLYWWDGEVQEGAETVLILKTRENLVSEVVERVKSLHSYDCPCIVSFDITNGNKDFLNWIDKETR